MTRLQHRMHLFTPLACFGSIDLSELNDCLVAWRHAMGPLNRPFAQFDRAFALLQDGGPVAVIAHSSLIAPEVAAIARADAVEVSRVCAARPDLCRVVLRLWRELVFPRLGVPWAVSYQHASLHRGHLYRHDGWVRLGTSRSGTDPRGGRRGYSKVIWGWSADPAARAARKQQEARRPARPTGTERTAP